MSRKGVFEGIGFCVPEKVLTNEDLEKMVDTSDDWIVQRTGIKERRICSDEEALSDLAIQAAKNALADAQMDASELDMVMVGTVTGDYGFPSVSCIVQEAIGAKKAGAFDVGAACAGFIYSTSIASAMIESGQVNNVLVIGGDTLTKFTDYTDRSTCILFGDGAGAAVLKAHENTDRGLIKSVMLSDGSGGKHITLEYGGSRFPACKEYSKARSPFIYMNGNETYRFAVNALGDALCKVLEEAGLEANDVSLFVPHQANIRIIQSSAKRIGLSEDKIFINIHKYGNTSAASIPIGLCEAVAQGRLNRGDIVMTVGFGAGLVWGANVIRW